ncbi:MAG: transcription elongation factor GreB [Myxococcota bacterium]
MSSEKKPITPGGFRRFQEELERLWRVDRPKIVQEVADAAALGDRSENAEYIYGKRKLREIDRRMGYLQGLLDRLVVIDPKTVRASVVKFGATVEVEDAEGQRKTYSIVGEDEVEASAGRISTKSPLGKALLGKKVGEVAVVARPAGELEIEIVALRYE